MNDFRENQGYNYSLWIMSKIYRNKKIPPEFFKQRMESRSH